MIKNILGVDFKYEDDKMYRLSKQTNKWNCCNDVKLDKGYIRIRINKKLHLLHRVIYKYFNPDWDITFSNNNLIDHIDINPTNNKIENLRVATRSQNNRNIKKKENFSSKYKGVYWDRNKWRATIRINSKTKHLGYFDNEEDAYECYKKAYDELMNF
jgi:hypothetical protein